jgi:hypothetical protein
MSLFYPVHPRDCVSIAENPSVEGLMIGGENDAGQVSEALG